MSRASNESAERCPICTLAMSDRFAGNMRTVHPCTNSEDHAFHYDCIKEWAHMGTCPLCRAQLKPAFLVQVQADIEAEAQAQQPVYRPRVIRPRGSLFEQVNRQLDRQSAQDIEEARASEERFERLAQQARERNRQREEDARRRLLEIESARLRSLNPAERRAEDLRRLEDAERRIEERRLNRRRISPHARRLYEVAQREESWRGSHDRDPDEPSSDSDVNTVGPEDPYEALEIQRRAREFARQLPASSSARQAPPSYRPNPAGMRRSPPRRASPPRRRRSPPRSASPPRSPNSRSSRSRSPRRRQSPRNE